MSTAHHRATDAAPGDTARDDFQGAALHGRLPLNPVLEEQGAYPFVRLAEAKAMAALQGADLIDFGVGEPHEETPRFIREALAGALTEVSTYPAAAGLHDLRCAVCHWVQRRFGTTLDPDHEILPTLGSKEAIFSLAQVLVDRGGHQDLVAVTTPGYPVPLRGAAFAGAEVAELPLRAENGFLPDPDDLPADAWKRLAILWVNSPNNPTGAVAPLELLAELQERCREACAVLAVDEAYSEVWMDGDAPPSALQLPDRDHVVVFNTLSKRSSMPGYRSGFVAGDSELIAALRRFRPSVGTAPQEFVQRASVAAWDDDAHVEEIRGRYRAKRDALLPALEGLGLRNAGGRGTFFLWLEVPGGDDEALAGRLLHDHGIVVTPGSFLGPEGAGYVRVALVPTPERCAEAAARLAGA